MKVTIFGDWHADTSFALQQLKLSELESDLYLHVGDFGIWPSTHLSTSRNSFTRVIERELARQGKELWFIDGNHESFPILKELPKDDRGLGLVRDHLFHIPRGYSWEIEGVKFLGLGGAVSIDRNTRTPGKDWFPEEEISDEDAEIAKRAGKVDVLLTHDAPILPVPKKTFGKDIDRDCEKSMNTIGEIASTVSPSIHVHGHYHKSYSRSFLEDSLLVGLDKNSTLTGNKIVISLSELREGRKIKTGDHELEKERDL